MSYWCNKTHCSHPELVSGSVSKIDFSVFDRDPETSSGCLSILNVVIMVIFSLL